MKDAEIYNIFDTQAILGRAPEVSISNTSGLAGIAYWINSTFSLDDANKVSKNDDLVVNMKNEIDLLYADGRTTIMSDGELYEMVNRLSNGKFTKN